MGVSNYGPKLLTRVLARLGERGVPLASNQINYSLLYRKQGAQATTDFCAEKGITVLGYFPLANGLLAGDAAVYRASWRRYSELSPTLKRPRTIATAQRLMSMYGSRIQV